MGENIIFPYRYRDIDVIAERMGNALLERLAWMTLKPNSALVLGVGISNMTDQLRVLYPELTTICSDISALSDQSSVDLILVNGALSFAADFEITCREYKRLLRPNGILMLAVFGLDTLKTWHGQLPIIPSLIDMHDLGDLLLHVGLVDPVLDTDYLTLSYRDKSRFLEELVAANLLPNDLTAHFSLLPDKAYLAPIEMIFAHAFQPAENVFSAVDGVVTIPLSHLKKKIP